MTVVANPEGPHGFDNNHRVLAFSDEYAPVMSDPVTGGRKVMTSTRFKAEGYMVRQLGPDAWVVDLDSRRSALPSGIEPPADTPTPPKS